MVRSPLRQDYEAAAVGDSRGLRVKGSGHVPLAHDLHQSAGRAILHEVVILRRRLAIELRPGANQRRRPIASSLRMIQSMRS